MVYCSFEGHNGFLSSSHPGIPRGIPAYLGLILGIPKGVMELSHVRSNSSPLRPSAQGG